MWCCALHGRYSEETSCSDSIRAEQNAQHLILCIGKMDSAPVQVLAAQALAITAQDWTCLGFSDDPQVAPTSDINVITERIVSLLAIRSVALLSSLEDFKDFSTTTICRTLLLDDNSKDCWPKALTEEIIAELRVFVKRILMGYNEKPYHNREHAYHVVLSCNKLLDLMLNFTIHAQNGNNDNGHERQHHQIPKTFGLRRNTLSQFTLLFAALIHDCQHGGVSNRQLTLEDDPLSLVYNDSSVLEQQSLTIAFAEFLQPEFSKLRTVLFPSRDVYSEFRKDVVNLVLATDIANPERMQLTKDKWKTAFGDMDQSEAKRDATISEISLPKQNGYKESRRRSVGSFFSELSIDLDAASNYGESLSDSSGHDEDEEVNLIGAGAQSFDTGSKASRGSNLRCQTPDSDGGLSLDIIDESDGSGAPKSHAKQANDRDGKVKGIDLKDLGYALHASKQNGDRAPRPEKSTTSDPTPKAAKAIRVTNRRGSTTGVPDGFTGNSFRRRRASIASCDSPMKRMQRRLSSTGEAQQGMKFRQRVGIMRTVDLSGETIENFSRRRSSIRPASLAENSDGNKKDQNLNQLEEYDEPDDLRATVVMETILLSCDVAHNLQGFDPMLKWSQKLFWELYDANKAGRGFDPSPGWVGGQTGFLQGYVLPLARKLGNTGVFSNQIGPLFAEIVEDTSDQWEIHGEDVTALLLSKRDLDLLAIRSRNHLSISDDQDTVQKENPKVNRNLN